MTVVAAAHDGSSLPACSATMYSAYQSDQFAFSLLAMGGRRARRIALARSDAEAKLVDHPGQGTCRRISDCCRQVSRRWNDFAN